MGWRTWRAFSFSFHSSGSILVLVIWEGDTVVKAEKNQDGRVLDWRSVSTKRKCSFLQAAKAGAPSKARVSFRDNFLLLISGSGLQGKWCVCHKFEEFADSSLDCSRHSRTTLPISVSNSPHCSDCLFWFFIFWTCHLSHLHRKVRGSAPKPSYKALYSWERSKLIS